LAKKLYINNLNNNIMQNIDKKIMYILRLNSKLKKLNLYINNNQNVPLFMKQDVNNATKKYNTIKNVLINLNYLNY